MSSYKEYSDDDLNVITRKTPKPKTSSRVSALKKSIAKTPVAKKPIAAKTPALQKAKSDNNIVKIRRQPTGLQPAAAKSSGTKLPARQNSIRRRSSLSPSSEKLKAEPKTPKVIVITAQQPRITRVLSTIPEARPSEENREESAVNESRFAPSIASTPMMLKPIVTKQPACHVIVPASVHLAATQKDSAQQLMIHNLKKEKLLLEVNLSEMSRVVANLEHQNARYKQKLVEKEQELTRKDSENCKFV